MLKHPILLWILEIDHGQQNPLDKRRQKLLGNSLSIDDGLHVRITLEMPKSCC